MTAMSGLAQALQRSGVVGPLGVVRSNAAAAAGLQNQQLQNHLGLLMGLKQHLLAGGVGKPTAANGAAVNAKRLGGDGENVRPPGADALPHQQQGQLISYQQLLMEGADGSGASAPMTGADGGKSFHWKKSKLI